MTREQLTELQAIMNLAVDLANRAHRMQQAVSNAKPVPYSSLPIDLVEIGAAAELARRPKDTVRSWCRAHPIDAGGFSMKLRGRWFVSRGRFLEFIRR